MLPDTEGARPYANVDNRLEVVDRDGHAYEVALAIPTAWFTLARDHLQIGREETVTLSIEWVGQHYLFSALTSTDKLIDLWAYTPARLPAWLTEPEYRLGHHPSAYRQA